MIPLLPKWVLTNKYPAFYDYESLSSIEQTARVYAKMQELIEDYNSFVDKVNENIENFINETEENQKCFVEKITKLIHDYIHSIDTKIELQNLEIEKAINYMKTNLKSTITELISAMKENGELDEAILLAFDHVVEKLDSINTKILEVKDTISQMNTRVVTLENTEYTLEYEEGTENLLLKKTVKESE